MPCTEKNYEQLAKALKGKAILQVEELKKFLLERKKTVTCKQQVPLAAIQEETKTIITKSSPQKNSISKENKEALQKVTQQLVLKSYSASTIKTYTNEFIQFFISVALS